MGPGGQIRGKEDEVKKDKEHQVVIDKQGQAALGFSRRAGTQTTAGIEDPDQILVPVRCLIVDILQEKAVYPGLAPGKGMKYFIAEFIDLNGPVSLNIRHPLVPGKGGVFPKITSRLKLIQDLVLVSPGISHAGLDKVHTPGTVPGTVNITVVGILFKNQMGHYIVQHPVLRG
jgi:hypothetical protein